MLSRVLADRVVQGILIAIAATAATGLSNLSPTSLMLTMRAGVDRLQGNFGAALSGYGEAIRLDPDRAEFYYNRAVVQNDLANFEQAIADSKKAIELDPLLADAYGDRGPRTGSLPIR